MLEKEKKNEGLYAWTAKVGTKGQIVIPKDARKIFKINPGDTVLILGDTKQGLALLNGNVASEKLNRIKSEE